MEKKFLIYVLYVTLLELRAKAYEANDNRTFWLCDLLHNVPASLESEESAKESYIILLKTVKSLGIEPWLEARENEFYSRFPQYKP